MDPLLKKLQFKGGVAVVRDAPPELDQVLQAWRDNDVDVAFELLPESSFVLAFVRTRAEIDRQAKVIVASLAAGDPVLWFAYPKKSSKRHTSDIGRDDSWQPLGDLGFEPVRQVAVDDDWSALRFRRAEDIGHMTRDAGNALSAEGRARAGGTQVTADGPDTAGAARSPQSTSDRPGWRERGANRCRGVRDRWSHGDPVRDPGTRRPVGADRSVRAHRRGSNQSERGSFASAVQCRQAHRPGRSPRRRSGGSFGIRPGGAPGRTRGLVPAEGSSAGTGIRPGTSCGPPGATGLVC